MYAVETIICSALFYALYRLLLEGRVAHSVARAYLVLSVLLSAVIPMLELPILCLLYTSDAADDMQGVDRGGRRRI